MNSPKRRSRKNALSLESKRGSDDLKSPRNKANA